MPRFYFHLTNGDDTLRDAEGFELSDARAARSMATSDVAGLLRRLRPIVCITDKLGVLVDAVPLQPGEDRSEPEATTGERVRQWQDWFGSIEEIVAAGYYEIDLGTGAFNCSSGLRRVLGLRSSGSVSVRDVLRRFGKTGASATEACAGSGQPGRGTVRFRA